MRKASTILATTCWAMTCWLAGAGPLWAQTTVAAMLSIRPKFDDVAVTNPTADEVRDLKVADVTDGGKKIGYALVDGRKQLVRRYVMGKGAPQINNWSFYKDGVEVFRQIDSNFDGKVDQYRWLGTAGLKWGVDRDQDGKIDVWHLISAEEVAQEAFQALATRDFARLKAVYISSEELKDLALPAALAAKIMQAQQTAPQKFQQALAKQANLDRATFLRVESGAPGCWLADGLGTSKDLIKYVSRSILYETAAKQHDWFLTGEMIQVGAAWRLVDLTPEDVIADNPVLTKLLAELSELEKQISSTPNADPSKANPALAGLYEQRAALAERIVAVAEPNEKETWYKQVLDSLSSAVIAGSEPSKGRLALYRKQFVEKMPGSNLAAYAVYRELWSQFAPKLGSDPKAQEAWNEQLARFVKDYPQADDAADALHQLGMSCEFGGADKEAEAAKYYRAIYTNFKDHHLAEWAQGAERRLKLKGNPLELSGVLTNNTPFDINQLKGKLAVVVYWASHTTSGPADFARLKQALTSQKDVILVCVNLDAKLESATSFLAQHPVQAFHILQAPKDSSGLRGALANYYGINVLPTVFLVGRDGRVINAKLQISDLEEALKKATPQ
ncbi:MAG: hypothetical protein L0Y71_13835 [Gemmataceae bacterium]|nr:hypothetical protein [Gemmataceae bacterium]